MAAHISLDGGKDTKLAVNITGNRPGKIPGGRINIFKKLKKNIRRNIYQYLSIQIKRKEKTGYAVEKISFC